MEQGEIYWDRFIPVQSINDRFKLCTKETALAHQFPIWREDFPGTNAVGEAAWELTALVYYCFNKHYNPKLQSV